MRRTIVFLIACGIVALFFYLNPKEQEVRETLMTFPQDPQAAFSQAETSLKVLSLADEDEYVLDWETNATLNQKAYLRQDLSLLFEDGTLKDKQSSWQEMNEHLQLKKEVSGEDSGYFEAVTIHTAELHYPNDITKSSRKMSYDSLYVIDSPLSPLHSFKEPSTKEEEESKELLDNIINQQLSYIWNDLIAYYNIPLEKYEAIPITKLPLFQSAPLPGLTEESSSAMMVYVWNVLYKNYYLGLTSENDKLISPLGSSLPLLLYTSKGDHFMILFQTADGKRVQLLRSIPD